MHTKRFAYLFISVLGCVALGILSAILLPVLHPGLRGESPVSHAMVSEIEASAQSSTGKGQSATQVLSPVVTVGESGLSFRYDMTYGYTEEPYIVDTVHINRPHGLFVDGTDNLYVVEEPGGRVLRYNSLGSNTLALGKAGVCYTDDYVFCVPQDVALDGSGNLWVADGNRIVQYDSTGSFMQQFPAGEPWESGSDNTRLNQARGIAFDSGGRMYVSDSNNHRIQVFDLGGGSPVYSTTIGTSGTAGSGSNQFNLPYRIAIDGSDRLYVVDNGNNRVQRCTFGGTWGCTTFDSGLNDPRGIAVDGSDNVYIADRSNGRLRKCSSAGTCSDLVTGTYLYDVAVDSSGYIYGAALYEDIVVQYNSSGGFVGTYLGTKFVPYLTDNLHYNRPRVAIDSSNNLIIVEEMGQRLLKRSPSGPVLWAVGVPGVDAHDNAHFNGPHGVAVDSSDRIYVADGWVNRVQIYDGDGTYLATLGTGYGTGDYEFHWPAGIAVGDNGYIYVSDANNHRVQVYDGSRVYVTTLGETGVCGSDNSHLCHPIGIEVDSAGNVYVADAGNGRVQKFDSSLQWQMTLGTTQSWGEDFDRFDSPEDIAVDAQGRVYVADIWNNRVQVFDANGRYLTTIGGAWGNGNSQFRGVSGVEVDSGGNVYVSDLGSGRIQRFALGVPGWQQANINGFGDRWNRGVVAMEAFGGYLYAGTSNQDSGTRIWRTADGTTWTAASEFGFASAYTNTIRTTLDFAVFNSQLYAGAGWGSSAGQIWRSSDGTTWTQVEGTGFGSANNNAVSAFAVFNNLLYAATDNVNNGLEIWRSSTGGASSWSQVVTGGFNSDPNNRLVCGFAEYDGYLYASVENTMDGVEIWRTNDGVAWTQANTSGFGDAENGETGGTVVFGDYLYAGTRNDTTGAQLWRSADGATWTQVMGNGFGNTDNRKLESLVVFDGNLYAVAGNYVTGMTAWRSADGATWMQINIDGFGDSNNDATNWSQATVAFDGSLYVGTWNWSGNGGEVWMMLHQVYLPGVLRNHGG